MRHFLPVCGCLALLTATSACDRSDRTRARQEAHDLRRKIDQAVNSGGPAHPATTEQAENKLRQGGEDLRRAGEKAGIKLDRATLIAKVKTKLATDIGLSTATSIQVDVRNQTVILTGNVASQDVKHQAEQVVGELDGVSKVINDLKVTP